MKSLNTSAVLYTYDGDGRRVKKSNGKLYWYGGGGLDALLETDAAGNTPTEYVFFGGKRTARRDNSGAVFYYFSNHLGSASVITNSAGTIVEESDYYPFGGERAVVNNDPNPYKFTGKERDLESGLDYFGARYHSSGLGRFTSVDPIQIKKNRLLDPQRLNLYTYTRNNPLAFLDPDGRDVIAISFQESHYARAGALLGNRLWSLGHAGVVTVDSKGRAFYYDKNGKGANRMDLGTLAVDKSGRVSNEALASTLQTLSKEKGESGEVRFAYFKANDEKVQNINGALDKRVDSSSPEKYDGLNSNCATFVANALEAGQLASTTAYTPDGMLGDVKAKAEFTGTLKDASDKSKEKLEKELDAKDRERKD